MKTRIQRRTKPDVRPVVATGGAVGGDQPNVTFYAYRDEYEAGVPEEECAWPAWSDIELHESTQRARYASPAARAYKNDRRAGNTHPGKIEIRDGLQVRLPPGGRRRTAYDTHNPGGHQLHPVPRWKRRADARAAEKAA